MCVPEVCSHEIVCVKGSVAPVAAGEEGAADVDGCCCLSLPLCACYNQPISIAGGRWDEAHLQGGLHIVVAVPPRIFLFVLRLRSEFLTVI